MTRKINGFTLIELAIVLVIIGLLIGGILVAQSMIQSAKIGSTVRAIQQYDIAVANFQIKYNSLPGDSVSFGGDGDNLIEDSDNLYWYFNNEIANFWTDLQKSGFTYEGKRFTATTPATGLDLTTANPNAPKISLDGKEIAIIGMNCDYSSGEYKNCFHFFVPSSEEEYSSGAQDTMSSDNFLKVTTAFAIDKKMDDGKPYTGNVTDRDIQDPGDCGGGGNYNNANGDESCRLNVKMLSQTGQVP